MHSAIYCPYTNSELQAHEKNIEHIIPLSLGGSNQFTIPVNAKFNAEAGSKIDAVLANDFFTLARRIKFDARGHTKKKPSAISKQSTLGDEKSPVQVEFFAANGLRVFDPIKKRNLIEKEIVEKKISSKFIINQFSRIRFCAKVALSAGYFVFGEWFRENVVHHELRALMNLESSPNAVDFENFQTTICEELSLPSVADRNQFAMEEMFCKFVNGSCVYFVPSKSSLLVSVGILGKYIATLNVPANTENFPFSCENDLGHAILLENGKMERISYRQFAKRTYDKLQMMKSS